MKASVYIREEKVNKTVSITSKNKPQIDETIFNKWQRLTNAIADVLEVPSVLIMQVTNKHMRVFLNNKNKINPYNKGDQEVLGLGLYCETVIGKDAKLLIPNALKQDAWKDNPDVKLDMIAYLGYPIKWHDGEIFGTLCALDSKTRTFDSHQQGLMALMKEMIEDDLKLIHLNSELLTLSNRDYLTNIYNRRYAFEQLKLLSSEKKRFDEEYSIIIMDLDAFKQVNDLYGHQKGDELLIYFTNLIQKSIRDIDIFCRLGGDEFMIIAKKTLDNQMKYLSEKLFSIVSNDEYLSRLKVSLSYGIASSVETNDINELYHFADKRMYAMKQDKK